jgi:hypothetical protein
VPTAHIAAFFFDSHLMSLRIMKDRFDKLLEVAAVQEQAKFKILFNVLF